MLSMHGNNRLVDARLSEGTMRRELSLPFPHTALQVDVGAPQEEELEKLVCLHTEGGSLVIQDL